MLQTLALKPSPAPNTRSPSEGPRRFHQGSWPGYQMRQTLCSTATMQDILYGSKISLALRAEGRDVQSSDVVHLQSLKVFSQDGSGVRLGEPQAPSEDGGA